MKRFSLPLVLVFVGLLMALTLPAFPATCSGGPRNGLVCFGSSDCGAACSGGPRNGLTCSGSSECGAQCNGGPRNGLTCSGSSECGATCSGGLRNGLTCFGSSDCPGGFCRAWSCQAFACKGFPCVSSLSAAMQDTMDGQGLTCVPSFFALELDQ